MKLYLDIRTDEEFTLDLIKATTESGEEYTLVPQYYEYRFDREEGQETLRFNHFDIALNDDGDIDIDDWLADMDITEGAFINSITRIELLYNWNEDEEEPMQDLLEVEHFEFTLNEQLITSDDVEIEFVFESVC